MNRIARRLCPLLPLPVAVASRLCPAFAGQWSRAVIAPATRLLAALSDRCPFPLAEPLALFLLAFLACGLLLRPRRVPAMLAGLLALLLAGYGCLWYPLYFAPGGSPRVARPPARAEALQAVAEDLIAALAQDAPAFSAGTERAFTPGPTPAAAPSAKTARWPEWMRFFHLAGLYIPWTGEALVSPLEPAPAQTFTAFHEAMHRAGIADEGRANIAAYRACVRAGGEAARSARLHALACVLPRLHALAPELWAADVARLDPVSLDCLRGMGGLTGAGRTRGRAARALSRWLGIDTALDSYGALADYLAAEGIGADDGPPETRRPGTSPEFCP